MGAIWYYHLLTLEITPRTVIIIDGHQPRQFTMGTSIGLKGEMG